MSSLHNHGGAPRKWELARSGWISADVHGKSASGTTPFQASRSSLRISTGFCFRSFELESHRSSCSGGLATARDSRV